MDKQSNRLQVKCIRSSKFPECEISFTLKYEVINGRYYKQSFKCVANCTTPNQRVSFLPNVISSACSSDHFAVHSFRRTFRRNLFLLEHRLTRSYQKSRIFFDKPRGAMKSREDSGLPAPACYHSTMDFSSKGAIPSALESKQLCFSFPHICGTFVCYEEFG